MKRLSLVLLVLAGCAPSIRKPESSQVIVTGTLYAGGFSRRGEPLTNAQVTLRRADTGDELASNLSSSAGGYRLAATVAPKTRVIFVAQAAGFAPVARAFTVGPFTELTVSAALTPTQPLECVDTQCDAPLVDLQWLEPPPGAAGEVATFEHEAPLRVAVDETQPALLSVGYAALDGGATGTLALRLPLASWASLTDLTPGTGLIEVAVARFDPATAKWTKLAPVALQTETGLPIPESALPSLQQLEFAGGAIAPVPVTQGFVAALGPAPSLGCVTGTLVADGRAAEGATFSFRGVEPVAADRDGAFCAPGPLGAERAASSGQYAGLPYALGSVTRPAASGACGGTCTAVGTIDVLPDALQLAALCKFTGRVIDAQGAPIANAEVVALDETVAGNAVSAFCGATGTRCTLAAPSAADGTFTLNAPLLTAVLVSARASATSAGGEAQRTATQRFESCPNEPLTLKLQHGTERLDVTASFTGAQLAWQPPRAAARVTVLDASGLPKWELVAPGGLLPPLTFGVVPSGATQRTAPTGAAASGDSLVVELEGVGRDGVVYLGTGVAARP